MSLKEMLRPGFEPESSARKAEMIGRTTLPEQYLCRAGKQPALLHDQPGYIYISAGFHVEGYVTEGYTP